MAFFEELGRKAKDVAAVAADKAKDMAAVAADKARETTEKTKISVAIAGEQREIEKNCRLIGEWFINEYEGELPEGVQELADAVAHGSGFLHHLHVALQIRLRLPQAAQPCPASALHHHPQGGFSQPQDLGHPGNGAHGVKVLLPRSVRVQFPLGHQKDLLTGFHGHFQGLDEYGAPRQMSGSYEGKPSGPGGPEREDSRCSLP